MFNFYTNFETLSPEEYQNNIVNFYNQTLGRTGIETTKPKEEDDDKDTGYVAPTIIPDDGQAGQTGISNILDFDYDIDNVVNFENLPSSYDEHLRSLGVDDKSDLTAFGMTVEAPSKEQFQKYGAAKGTAAIFGLTGLPVEIGASMIAGKTQKNMFGVDEFKPTGTLGVIQDFSESARLDSYNKNKTKYTEIKNAFAMGPEEFSTSPTKDFNNYMRGQDYGFSVNSKNAGSAIYRDHGSRIYNGAGMIGIDQETARRMEALKRGYETSNYDPTNPTKSGSLVGAGYDERGYHHTINGTAAMGREKDAIELGKMYGLTLDETKNILGDVRSRRSTFGRTIEGKTLSQMLSEARDRKEQREQEQQRQQQEQLRQQQEQQRQQQQQEDSSSEDRTEDSFEDEGGQDVYSEGYESYGDDDGGGFGSDTSGTMGGEEVAMGGRIGMQEGGNTTEVVQPAGFIAPDPNATDQQEIADDKPMDARDGDFIINAPAAEEAGKQDIQRMINTAIKNLKEKGVDVRFGDPKINIADKVKLLVSRNEVYIPAIIAKEIGYDRLKKINNRGKREVQRRQEESQQDEKPQARGFIQKKKGDVVEDRGFVTAPVTRDVATFTAFKNFLKKRKPLRADIENFIDTIPGDKSRLGLLAGVEAPLETSTLPELEAIIQTIVNRVNDRTYEYRNINTIKEIMKQRSTRGTGSKMFMYDGLERKHIRPRIQEIIKNPKVFQAGLDAAENVLTKGGGEPDYEMEMLPPDVFQYSVAGKPSAVNDKNPKLKFYKKIGKHNFYRRVP